MAIAADALVRDKLFIDGEWVDPAGDGVIEVVNPTTEEVVGRIPEGTPEDADRAVRAARAAFEEWSQTLTAGDIDGAAELFALPSLAQNAGPPLRIDSLADAKLFNSSLPCGAVLTEATAAHGLTIATFRLTERPGPGSCGSGTDAEAQTAFGIEDGEIVEWRRVVPADDDVCARLDGMIGDNAYVQPHRPRESHRRAGHLPRSDVEGHCHQRPGLHVYEVPRADIAGVGASWNEDAPLGVVERLQDDVRRLRFDGAHVREKERFPIW